MTDLSVRAVKGMNLRPFTYCDYGFESRLELGCLPLVNVVCCNVEVSASG